MKTLSAVAALVSLGLCLAAPVLYFAGALTGTAFKMALVPASLGWFFFAALWASARKKSP